MINEQGYGAIYPYTWWGNRQDLGFGTSYPFLLNRYGGAAAAYSLRSLSSDNLNVVRVRRDSDNAERDFKATEVTDGTLQNWVNGGLDDLPLDTATAAAAYSLRNLKSDYSGSVVRVRRSSDNAEADFTAAEVTDGTLTTFVGAGNDGFVTTWYDQAGSNNATQGTASSQPKIVDAGSLVTENGKAAVSFDGVDDSIATSNNFIANTDLSFFTLHKFNSLTTKPQDILSQGATNLSDGFKYGMSGSGQNQFYLFLSATASYNDGNTTISQELHSLINTISATTLNINSIDTSLSISGIAGRVGNNNDPLTIGQRDSGGGYYNGKMQEILVYTSDQTTNRTKIENNISTYYDIYDTSANGYVATWYDQSVNGNNATQATASRQPQIVSNGVIVTENGKPSLDFDGTAINIVTSTISEITQPATHIAVLKYTAGETTEIPFSSISDVNGRNLSYKRNSNYAIFAGNVFESTTSVTNDQQSNFTIFDGANSSMWKNNTLIIDNEDGGTQTIEGITIGSDDDVNPDFLGKIQEYIVYASDQSANREAIETNINNYFNIYP